MRVSRISAAALALAAAVCVLFAGLSATAQEAAAPTGKPMIVKIHADWCGTCTQLEPTIEALRKEVGGEARIVVLDVTDRDAVARSSAEADRLGIREFFDFYKGSTGTVGVLTPRGDAVAVMKGELDPKKYEAALEEAKQG